MVELLETAHAKRASDFPDFDPKEFVEMGKQHDHVSAGSPRVDALAAVPEHLLGINGVQTFDLKSNGNGVASECQHTLGNEMSQLHSQSRNDEMPLMIMEEEEESNVKDAEAKSQ